MFALDVFSFCFPDEGHRGRLPLCLFHKLCVHMHGNKTKFEWNVLVQSTRVLSHDLHGKTKRLKRFIDPLNHDSWSFSEKKGLTNKKLKKSMKRSSLFCWVSCVSLGILCMLLKSVFGVMNWSFCHYMFTLHCIWIPVYLVRGVGRLPPGPILTFYILVLREKVPCSFTFYWQMVPLSHN